MGSSISGWQTESGNNLAWKLGRKKAEYFANEEEGMLHSV